MVGWRNSNSTNGIQTITLIDTTPPVITCPSDIVVNNDPGVCGATVNYPIPTATDNCSSPLAPDENSTWMLKVFD